MNGMRRIIVGVALGGSLLTGGVIGATIAGPLRGQRGHVSQRRRHLAEHALRHVRP